LFILFLIFQHQRCSSSQFPRQSLEMNANNVANKFLPQNKEHDPEKTPATEMTHSILWPSIFPNINNRNNGSIIRHYKLNWIGEESVEERLWRREIDQAAVAAVTHRDFQVQHEIKLDDKYLFIFIPIFLYFLLSIQHPVQFRAGHARVNVEGNENNFLPNNKSCSNSSKLQTAMDIR
jgi:hypothetical protein